LIVSISDSLCLLICFGFDVHFRPACVMLLCDEEFYKNKLLQSYSVMEAYYNIFGSMEEDIKADGATNIYAIRASGGLVHYALFDNTMFLGLDVDTAELDIRPGFFKEQRRGHSPLRADMLKRQRDFFCF
jgi:hypothetical protein